MKRTARSERTQTISQARAVTGPDEPAGPGSPKHAPADLVAEPAIILSLGARDVQAMT
jgi:hypothetical protein